MEKQLTQKYSIVGIYVEIRAKSFFHWLTKYSLLLGVDTIDLYQWISQILQHAVLQFSSSLITKKSSMYYRQYANSLCNNKCMMKKSELWNEIVL